MKQAWLLFTPRMMINPNGDDYRDGMRFLGYGD
jgi:hypothetical protein